MSTSKTKEWWRGAVIYQIYPRSYFDSNNDGIGDLAGIQQKLPYIASLGVDGIWLSPFFKSPMKDFGYDVSDYRDVDPMFGTIADFKNMIRQAHDLGLKVMIDQVLSHTSDEHAWFRESRASKDNPKADWYVWADPKPDGTPPNNWLSIFGGSAWQFDSRRRQYYLHNFLVSQPDLNFHNVDVRKALLEEVKFWLDLGVDGFRLDTVNFYFHSQGLQDNPPVGAGEKTKGAPEVNPYSMQKHRYDLSQPENLGFLQELRALLDQYEDVGTVGEIGDDEPLNIMAQYTSGGDKLHMAYTFDLLNVHNQPDYIRGVIKNLEASVGDGWPCWALSNHDVVRHVSRWGKGEHPSVPYGKVLLAMLTSLRGSVCLYQGEELGLPEAEVPFAALQDPYGIEFWPEFKGRDGCRTPMPWRNAEHGGFSSDQPWLPVDSSHLPLAVSEQELNEASMLHQYRRFLAWRRQQPALITGDIEFIDHPSLLMFWRRCEDQQLLAIINLTGSAHQVDVAQSLISVTGHGLDDENHQQGNQVTVAPYSAFYGERQGDK